jgi:hypothetical protein
MNLVQMLGKLGLKLTIRFFNGFKKYFKKSNAAKKAVKGTPRRKSSGMFLSVSEGFCSCVEIRQFFPEAKRN